MVGILGSDEEVVRYVGGSNFNIENRKVDGSAFDRKPKDDDGLSFTRRNFLSDEDDLDRDQIRKIFASRMKVGGTSQFAQLRIGDAIDNLSGFGELFEFVEDHLDAEGDGLANPAHALLTGLPFKDEAVGSLRSEVAGDLLARCVNDVFEATLRSS